MTTKTVLISLEIALKKIPLPVPYLISEYDGWESVITARDFW